MKKITLLLIITLSINLGFINIAFAEDEQKDEIITVDPAQSGTEDEIYQQEN